MKELSIEGIKPPPHSVAFGTYATTNIATQVRPVVNLPTAGNYETKNKNSFALSNIGRSL